MFISSTSHLENPIDIAIEKFKNHPSVISINENISSSNNFDFETIQVDDVLNELNNLDGKKKGTFGNIPTKCLKEASLECTQTLTNVWNQQIIGQGSFPNDLKLADVTPIFKNSSSSSVKNYRPISVLPSVSKVFERLMQKQINVYFDKYLSNSLCGYRKGFSTQTALLSLLEKWKITLDKKGYAGAVLMDLSKAFDTINHELLIAKLKAYGFSNAALTFISSYLSDRWQHTKINNSFSSWTELLQGVPQGSVLGPLLLYLS